MRKLFSLLLCMVLLAQQSQAAIWDIGAHEANVGGPSCPSVTPALIGAWSFDNTGADATGNGHTASPGTGVSYTAAGKYNQGATFTGAGGFTVADANDLDFCAGYTLATWIKLSNTSADYSLISKNPNSTYFLFGSISGWCGTGKPIGGHSAGSAIACYGTSLDTNWHHLAVTYDGANVVLYFDGSAVTTISSTALIPPTTGTLQFCTSMFNEHCPSGTVLDEIKIYNYARSGTEIVVDMNTPINTVSTTQIFNVSAGSTWKMGAGSAVQKIEGQ